MPQVNDAGYAFLVRGHTLLRENHSLARALHFLVLRGPMVERLVSTDADGDGEQDEMECENQRLTKEDKSNFRNFDLKTLTKPVKITVVEEGGWS
jgi:hypothetical protein